MEVAPNTDHLLDGSLEWLHTQTIEWMKEIEFWREEMTFFYNLLHKTELKAAFPTQELSELEKELVKISGEDLDKLKSLLQQHERALKKILEHVSREGELDYRHDHTTILYIVSNFQQRIRTFKKTIFDFVKKP
jgi:hypothetical protein